MLCFCKVLGQCGCMSAPLSSLIACPSCDALYTAKPPQKGERSVCARCHTVLIAPRRNAGLKIIAYSAASLILVIGAMTFPFLGIHVAGLGNDASLIDAALAFSDGIYVLLSLAVIGLIVFMRPPGQTPGDARDVPALVEGD